MLQLVHYYHQNYIMELRVRVMSLEETRRTQRPYRYGMMLLCVGALVNWLGLAENYSEPVRYAGVACILGACLICTAMCCWLHTPGRSGTNGDEGDDPVHVISANDERRSEKPPDYDTVAAAPPSYDDAIKLDPAALLHLSIASNVNVSSNANINYIPTVHPSSSHTMSNSNCTETVQSTEGSQILDCSITVCDEKMCSEKPPPYAEPVVCGTSISSEERTSRSTN
ncbi:uncharacterized protein LOC121597049 isoform X2 [Anopheles merus]|uniref:uncharacterized protein LOC121597049 isoform X2 n=1 Tax=Anopheles merus TaxID=30066 RepID=UPI001BE4C2DF|nr:uncharacterized protein LOC121597049 isoform X2 [Anopheles merus]